MKTITRSKQKLYEHKNQSKNTFNAIEGPKKPRNNNYNTNRPKIDSSIQRIFDEES